MLYQYVGVQIVVETKNTDAITTVIKFSIGLVDIYIKLYAIISVILIEIEI